MAETRRPERGEEEEERERSREGKGITPERAFFSMEVTTLLARASKGEKTVGVMD